MIKTSRSTFGAMDEPEFESFGEAALEAYRACEFNTAAYYEAWDTETEERWDRDALLSYGERVQEKLDELLGVEDDERIQEVVAEVAGMLRRTLGSGPSPSSPTMTS